MRIARILALDIGGTGIKAAVIGPDGSFLQKPRRLKTPRRPTPEKLLALIPDLVKPFTRYDRVSVGFPGYVRGGKVYTAPNLGTEDWAGFALEKTLRKIFGKPVRLLNDADMQGLAVIKGIGLELVCTLGTGFGTSVFHNGKLLPHMDLAHMAIHGRNDFDIYLGNPAMEKIGRKAWNKRVGKTLAMLEKVFFFDTLYLGGGNSRHVRIKLPPNVVIVSNDAGMRGGAFAWLPRPRA